MSQIFVEDIHGLEIKVLHEGIVETLEALTGDDEDLYWIAENWHREIHRTVAVKKLQDRLNDRDHLRLYRVNNDDPVETPTS